MTGVTGVTRILPRSFLYVPGNRPDLFAKGAAGPADALVLDLEDAVPVPERAAARREVIAWLGGRTPGATGPEVWVRVSPDFLAEDLGAAVRPGVQGLFIAKCSAEHLDAASQMMSALEEERGTSRLDVVGLVETAAAVRDLARIAAHPRLTTLGIGEVDLLGDLRMTRSPRTAAAVDALRTQVVMHCSAAGRAAPVAPTSTDFRDLAAFEDSTHHLLDLGFRSRTAIHPSQIDVIHTATSPSPETLAQAQEIVDQFSRAKGGITLDAQGRLIDAAVVREAVETLARRR
ncbi:HpcH/HpaI aldolase/citrate lyase family protein [Aeromicrobium yanjiei]|uniref:CoA ester lyase n=1 Tax=Aeromicrobium yanjiei TaxID=2662028 RepID=A0A5Q2MIS6_9ACTN|nr:CoA ester lyase [Aeromicrobium yanjiei]QGG40922.1 CoA ester lyase [Aeromicrobium yanjiei]